MLRRSPFMLVVVLLLAAVAAPVAMAWTSNGVQVNTGLFGGTVGEVKTLPDGSGGLFVLWTEMRFGSMNVYLQRINSSGASQWNPINTGIVCQAAGEQSHLSMASDNAGGVLITWEDQRVGGGQVDVYAHRFGANGIAVSGWPSNGLLVASSALRPQVVRGVNGVTWIYYHGSSAANIQRAKISYGGGAPSVTYPSLTAAGDLADPIQCVSDNFGGAVCAWGDAGSIKLQRFDSSGTALWWDEFASSEPTIADANLSRVAYNGQDAYVAFTRSSPETGDDVGVSYFRTGPPIPRFFSGFSAGGPGSQNRPDLLLGPFGDYLVAWHDEQDIYAARVPLFQSTCAGSQTVTVRVTDTSAAYSDLSLTVDGNAGAMLVWAEGGNIFGKRVRGNMTLGTLQTLCTATGTQSVPVAKFTDYGSVVTAWIDGRSASLKIYAQQTVFDPYEGLPAEVCDNGFDEDCDGYGGGSDPECCSNRTLYYGQCDQCDGSGVQVCADLPYPWSPPVIKQLCCP